MKSTILTTLLVISQFLTLQANDIPVSSTINNVVVYLNGAQINRTAKANLQAGENSVRFVQLSPFINQNSIQISATGNVVIGSVNRMLDFLSEEELPKEIKDLKNELESQKLKLELRSNLRYVYEEEKKMITSNRKVNGANTNIDVEDLLDLSDFYRTKLKEVQYKILELNREEKELKVEIQKLQKQLNELTAKTTTQFSEIIVVVTSKSVQTVNFKLSFVVNGAGWQPSYDVRTNEANGPIALTYKGRVRQNTGVNWNNIMVTLSTGNPTIGNTKPVLNPWVLRPDNGRKDKYKATPSAYMNSRMAVADSEEPKESEVLNYNGVSMASQNNTTQSNTNTEFNIGLTQSILSNNKPYDLAIAEHSIEASYNFFAAPKVDKDAFLIAGITAWQNLDLLPGQSNVFYKDTYVGNAYLNTNSSSDTLLLSMGRDRSIVIDRKKTKDFSRNQVLGATRKTEITIEITLRNNKNIDIEMELEDQIPISSEKSIEIELLDKDGAKVKESTGKLTWAIRLKAGEQKTIQFKYSVKHPKDMDVYNF